MEAELKKTLKAVTLELRHLLEGRYDQAGKWQPGDLEQRLAAIGVRRDRASVPVDELGHLPEEDRRARKVVDAYLKLREEAGVERPEAVAEFVRETAYTWANRLLALRCMEARELIDPVILQQEAYGGRSLEHHRLAQRHPELCAGDDDGLFAVLDKVFRVQAERLPMLFEPQAPGIALRPSAAALKDCFGLLSLTPDTLRKYRIRLTEDETASPGAKPPNLFTAPDALGWAYQYWNTEEKDRVFEKVRTVKGAKIAGADIIPATQLYTEDYMVKFLVQNSLGATWMGMHPQSKLAENWEYYVKDADRVHVEKKPVREITFLDPACGSGHFHLEAFDLCYAMYQEEGELTAPEEICNAILTKNLFGIDIDPRAVQIAEVALWMKAAERAFDYKGVPTNLVAATASHLKGEAWEEFLAGFEREPSVARVLRQFARTMEHIDEIGSLARPDEDLREIIKEEHATWERQVSEKKEANFLFSEMNEAVVSGQLPFQEISDEEFGNRLFYRAKAGIDAFTERARASGEFEDQMLGSETLAGFRLVDLLSRPYDVVAANPPYMGSKNMGPELRSYVEMTFVTSKRDLFAAFMTRSLTLALPTGRVGMIVPQTWMYAHSYATFRSSEHASEPSGVLRQTRLEALAQLGRHAFTEADPPSNVVLITWQTSLPNPRHRPCCFRLTASQPAKEQAALLRAACSKQIAGLTFTPQQLDFVELPNAPVVYYLHPAFFELLKRGNHLGDVATVRQGLATANKERFIRTVWESANNKRWLIAAHGGGFGRWWGPNGASVDWQHDGARIKSSPGVRVQSEAFYRRNGFWYAQVARGSLGLRRLWPRSLFTNISSGVFPTGKSDKLEHSIMALLNSRVANYLLRALSQKTVFSEGYPPLLPWPDKLCCTECVDFAFQLKRFTVQHSHILDADYVPHNSEHHSSNFEINTIYCSDALRHAAEGVLDHLVANSLGLPDAAIQDVISDTGRPVGWFALITGYDEIPVPPDGIARVPKEINQWLAGHGRCKLNVESLDKLRQRVRSAYEAGSGGEPEDDEPAQKEAPDESDEADAETQIAVRPDTFLEELSQRVEIHPISVYWLIKEGTEKESWLCVPEKRRLWADRITVTIVRLLGHRWPMQIEVGDPVLDWAEPDGIIPFTPLAKELTLVDRVQQRLRADESDANDFDEVMGKPLDAWLATEFFKHHTKQFKKRPIAWQLQSGKFTATKSPTFACLLYFHNLDADTLPKLNSQYVGPLRQRLETELRGITAIAADARSDRQVKRRGELEDAILELQKLDALLETVARSGFVTEALRQHAVDDAMLALKAHWLRRLTELIAKSPLPEWLAAADRTELHPDFRVWVAEAMAHLDYFCASVGPKEPDQAKLTPDTTAADLAKVITPHAKEMVKDTLELACDKWYAQFDEIVLGPDKDKVKKLREEQKSCEEQLVAGPAPETTEIRDLEYRVKEVKQDVKVLTAKIKRRAAFANTVRTQIEGWQSKDPAGWGNWLTGQPLFDRIASLDGRRAPPTTIAEFIAQESMYAPDINDGVRVNIAPLQKAGVLAADVLAGKDLDKAIADRGEWRADERRWVREGKLPQPGWWPPAGEPAAKGNEQG